MTPQAPPAPLTGRGLLLALLVTLIWGLNFVGIRLSVEGASPLLVVALRFLLAAFPAVLFVPRPALSWRVVLAYGVAGGALQFGLLYLAIHLGVSAGLASLLMQVQAFFTALLAAAALREPVAPNQWAGMAVAFTGMGVIGLLGDHHMSAVGLLLILGGALGWAVGNVLVRRFGPVNVLSLGVWSSLVPPVPLALLAGLTSGWSQVGHTLLGAGPGFWAAIAYMAYGNTLFGFGVWNLLIGRHGASRVAPLSLLVPVFGLASNALYFHEVFGPLQVVGALLVFGGLLLHVFGARVWRAARQALSGT
ncbi:EamA family transporter [Deinococcus apachensis]|uniref:EamA family transporter n=1 Tax=Deinococcus apachensis TaxID=309886 RepID=UPI000369648C|nr:EamA family transporter [Deinococcus apachensis]